MNRETMRKQVKILRNKKDHPPPIARKAPPIKPKAHVKKGVVKVEPFSTKRKAPVTQSPSADQLAERRKHAQIMRNAQSKHKTSGCGGCTRRSNG